VIRVPGPTGGRLTDVRRHRTGTGRPSRHEAPRTEIVPVDRRGERRLLGREAVA
jgi:hypothetical protein